MLYVFGKPLKRAFRRCMGWGGGGREPYFLRNLAETMEDFGFFALFWSGSKLAAQRCMCVDPQALVGQLVTIFWEFYGFSWGKCMYTRGKSM